ncbi:hypothetical protein Agabi119p4_383 [Agaricus bisporus var. burnettii]|uniref:WD40 repeat-like protein n=1 Tax=Agaricus bisporus var. burnettii TaxID=192524 RepID=A0A8H7FAU3_AGABI|nr:hypothetical protein Agabi119p4_383 [Agaricus bisporus var. burnettii]
MAAPPFRITADEINCLIYSYFKDSGFNHSAFALFSEGSLKNSPWFSKHIPRGELIDLLSKALLYIEVESHWRGDSMTTNCKNRFSLLERHVCTDKPSPTVLLKPPATSRFASSLRTTTHPSNEDASISRNSQIRRISSDSFYSINTPQVDGPVEKRAKREFDDMDLDSSRQTNTRQTASAQGSYVNVPAVTQISSASQENGVDSLKRPRSRISQGPIDETTNPQAIMILSGHRKEVFVCSFNPTKHTLLATGSKDAVVNLWNLPSPPASRDQFATWNGSPITVDNYVKDVQGDLTALNWNSQGTLLAVGSYDSILRIFTSEGNPYFTNHQHRGPIFSVRFSQDGRLLLSASLDETTCLWDVKEKRLLRQFRCHQDCCLDVEWMDATTFATAGADGNIYVMKTDNPEPIKKFSGHEDEINQLKYNPSRTRLASCSDDTTTRVWRVDKIDNDSEETIPGLATSEETIVLTGHTHSVNSIGWLPVTDTGTNEIVATSSFDCTVRVWDAMTGKCIKVLADHKRPVYTLIFSPDGKWLATGGGDGYLFIYSTKTWEKKWTWFAGLEKPGVFEIAWQMVAALGLNRLAVSLECRQVAIVDASKIPVLQDTDQGVVGAIQSVP